MVDIEVIEGVECYGTYKYGALNRYGFIIGSKVKHKRSKNVGTLIATDNANCVLVSTDDKKKVWHHDGDSTKKLYKELGLEAQHVELWEIADTEVIVINGCSSCIHSCYSLDPDFEGCGLKETR